ncbi:MAG: Zn-ribbon domain-containing OB-fold protein [candidate division Zixibacteria bacterium]|nr:Zn-ribbon domain-containing OB-fold protein [candidate division Zixibacteria bacterium]
MFKWFGKVNFSPYTKVTDFADHLKDGHLMASKCKQCGQESFPPKADCSKCLSGEFEFTEYDGQATLLSFTKIHAAPTGFEDTVPYTVGVVDLKDGGRLLAWFGESIAESDIKIGMDLQVVPQIFEEIKDIKVYYSLEKPGTTWSKV